jgi:predicted DNA-binding transcriptional regulator YafY
MVAEAISIRPYEHRALVRIETSVEEAAGRITPYEGVVGSSVEHGTTVELGGDNFDWLAGYLVGLGFTLEVIEPVALRAHMAVVGQRIFQAHGEAPTRREVR